MDSYVYVSLPLVLTYTVANLLVITVKDLMQNKQLCHEEILVTLLHWTPKQAHCTHVGLNTYI